MAPLTAYASVPGIDGGQRASQTVTGSYTVMFTGPIANGSFTSNLTLLGFTNEDISFTYTGSGGYASASLRATSAQGTFLASLSTGPNPRPACGFNGCDLPFTVGIPITLDVTLTASVDWGTTWRNPLGAFGESTATFGGIGTISNPLDSVTITPVTVTTTANPEPASFGLAGLAIGALALKSRSRVSSKAKGSGFRG